MKIVELGFSRALALMLAEKPRRYNWNDFQTLPYAIILEILSWNWVDMRESHDRLPPTGPPSFIGRFSKDESRTPYLLYSSLQLSQNRWDFDIPIETYGFAWRRVRHLSLATFMSTKIFSLAARFSKFIAMGRMKQLRSVDLNVSAVYENSLDAGWSLGIQALAPYVRRLHYLRKSWQNDEEHRRILAKLLQPFQNIESYTTVNCDLEHELPQIPCASLKSLVATHVSSSKSLSLQDILSNCSELTHLGVNVEKYASFQIPAATKLRSLHLSCSQVERIENIGWVPLAIIRKLVIDRCNNDVVLDGILRLKQLEYLSVGVVVQDEKCATGFAKFATDLNANVYVSMDVICTIDCSNIQQTVQTMIQRGIVRELSLSNRLCEALAVESLGLSLPGSRLTHLRYFFGKEDDLMAILSCNSVRSLVLQLPRFLDEGLHSKIRALLDFAVKQGLLEHVELVGSGVFM